MKTEDLQILAEGGNFLFFPSGIDMAAEGGAVAASAAPSIKNVFSMLRMPAGELKNFHTHYHTPAARERRLAAVEGMQKAADDPLAELLEDAARLPHEADPDLAAAHALSITRRFADLAAAGDHRPFQRMAAIVKNGGARNGTRGDKHHLEGRIFHEFCRFVCCEKRLPAKAELRRACDTSPDDCAVKLFREACNRLGLSGLPHGSKTHPEN